MTAELIDGKQPVIRTLDEAREIREADDEQEEDSRENDSEPIFSSAI